MEVTEGDFVFSFSVKTNCMGPSRAYVTRPIYYYGISGICLTSDNIREIVR